MGKIIAVCRSSEKGTRKENIGQAWLLENYGLEHDAHAGPWHRQVSLLAAEQIEAFRARGAQVLYGDFGENLVVEGYDLKTLPIGTRLQCGTICLQVTQIGKHCHQGCAIYQQMGDCIMPREGIFACVVRGGQITVGDEIHVVNE